MDIFTCVQTERPTQARALFQSLLSLYGTDFRCLISGSYVLNQFQKITTNQINNAGASC